MVHEGTHDGSRKVIELPGAIAAKDLALLVGRKPVQVVTDLLGLKVMVELDEPLPFEVAARLAKEYGFEVRRAG